MAENGYGVYASFRLPSGELVSSSRETVDELKADLDALLGDDNGFLERFERKEAVVADAGASPAPVAPPAPAVVEGSAPAGSPSVDDLPAEGFKPCEKCGTLKDKWNPPGFSKRTQKSYAGFFGCPNFANH